MKRETRKDSTSRERRTAAFVKPKPQLKRGPEPKKKSWTFSEPETSSHTSKMIFFFFCDSMC